MTRKRLALAVLALAFLAVTAGCSSPFSSAPSDDTLDEDAPYEWNASADVYVNITGPEYHAVYDVAAFEGTEFEMWLPGLDSRNPLSISALRYRYPNGTIVKGSELDVEESGGATVVTLPTSRGKLAFTASTGNKRVTIPTYMEGSYHVVLPKDTRASFPLFGDVSPSPDDSRVDESTNRVHMDFEQVTRTLSIKWYLQRDIWIFGAIVAILGVITVIGVSYYLYQLKLLEQQREDLGLDITDEDDGRDPPPGMG